MAFQSNVKFFCGHPVDHGYFLSFSSQSGNLSRERCGPALSLRDFLCSLKMNKDQEVSFVDRVVTVGPVVTCFMNLPINRFSILNLSLFL